MSGLIDFDGITEGHLRQVGGSKWRRDGVIGAGIAEMDFGVAPPIRAAVERVLDAGRLGYTTDDLVDGMADAYVAWAGEHYGWDVDPARVRPMPDVLCALSFLLDELVPAGKKVVVPTPAYMPFLFLPTMHGREIVEVPMARDGDSWVYDLDALDAALADDAGVLVLCNPHNPIGRVLEPREMREVTEVVEKHGVRVFSDEIHAPIVFPGHAHVPYASTSEAAAAHTVTATSASKAWNIPGLKTAQVVLTNEDDLEVWRRRSVFVEHGAAVPGLVANAAAYREGEPWLAEVLGYVGETRQWFADLVASRLPGAVASVPEGTYLSLVDLRGVDGAESLWGDAPGEWLLERAGVETVEGSACGRAAVGCVRFNLGTTREIIGEAVERIVRAVEAAR